MHTCIVGSDIINVSYSGSQQTIQYYKYHIRAPVPNKLQYHNVRDDSVRECVRDGCVYGCVYGCVRDGCVRDGRVYGCVYRCDRECVGVCAWVYQGWVGVFILAYYTSYSIILNEATAVTNKELHQYHVYKRKTNILTLISRIKYITM